jgi:hypothetical protein
MKHTVLLDWFLQSNVILIPRSLNFICKGFMKIWQHRSGKVKISLLKYCSDHEIAKYRPMFCYNLNLLYLYNKTK